MLLSRPWLTTCEQVSTFKSSILPGIMLKIDEEADKLAHDACESANCHRELLNGLPVREHIHWPLQKQPDSQVTLCSIKKAITQPASSWLNMHEPLLRDIVSCLKNLTDAGHHVHLGKVKAHMGVRGNILADAAAKAVVTQKNLDADPDNMVGSSSTQELRDAQIDIVCQVNSNAHEHDEWPVHPIPICQGTDDRHLEEMEKLLIEGTWPDGDERRADQGRCYGGNVAPAAMDAQQSAGLRATEDDGWQARNLSTSLSTLGTKSVLQTWLQQCPGCVCTIVA